jgi:hypothetical protein
MTKLILTLLFALSAVFYCRESNAQPKIDWSRQEDKAAELVLKLPEVIKADKQCRRLSKGKRHLITYVPDDPTPGDNYFQVFVAEDNGTAYHTWFIFGVKLATYKIYYCDRNTGDYIPLDKWRRNPNKYM